MTGEKAMAEIDIPQAVVEAAAELIAGPMWRYATDRELYSIEARRVLRAALAAWPGMERERYFGITKDYIILPLPPQEKAMSDFDDYMTPSELQASQIIQRLNSEKAALVAERDKLREALEMLRAARNDVLEEAAKAVEPSNMDRPDDWTEYTHIKAECAAATRAMKEEI
jgi:hypothetical protein